MTQIKEFFAKLPWYGRLLIMACVVVCVWRFLGADMILGFAIGAVTTIVALYKGGALSITDIGNVSDWAIDFFRKTGNKPTDEDIQNHMK
jgi:hypothetical protein